MNMYVIECENWYFGAQNRFCKDIKYAFKYSKEVADMLAEDLRRVAKEITEKYHLVIPKREIVVKDYNHLNKLGDNKFEI